MARCQPVTCHPRTTGCGTTQVETGVLCTAAAWEEKECVRGVSPALGFNPTHPGTEGPGQGKPRQQCLWLPVAYKGHRDERPEPMQPPKRKVGDGRAKTRAPGTRAQSRKGPSGHQVLHMASGNGRTPVRTWKSLFFQSHSQPSACRSTPDTVTFPASPQHGGSAGRGSWPRTLWKMVLS